MSGSTTDRPDSFFNARDTRGGLEVDEDDARLSKSNVAARYHDDFGSSSMDRVISRKPKKTTPPASPRKQAQDTASLSTILNSPSSSSSSPKTKRSSSASVGAPASLGSMLDSPKSPHKTKQQSASSNTVAGDQVGDVEIKVLPDGRKVKVKRVLKKAKSTTAAGTPPMSPVKTSADGGGEFYRREDGTLVKRVVRRKSAAGNALSSPKTTTNNNHLSNLLEGGSPNKQKKISSSASVGPPTLGSLLDSPSSGAANTRHNSASATVAGDQITTTGEITVLPDGRKVRKVMRRASTTNNTDGGDGGGEFYRREDGKLVKRVVRRKSTAPPSSNTGLADLLNQSPQKNSPKKTSSSASVGAPPSLGSMLDAVPKPPLNQKASASNTVAGDQIAGEITVLPDGRKVRKVIRRASTATGTAKEAGVIRREDGTLVKRVIRRKSEAGSALSSSSANDITDAATTTNSTSGGLSDFMAQDAPKSPKKTSSSASVGAPTSLGAMLDSAEKSSAKNSAANTVAGDPVKEASPRRSIFRRKTAKADAPTAKVAASGSSSRSLQSAGSNRSLSAGDEESGGVVPTQSLSQDTDATPTATVTSEASESKDTTKAVVKEQPTRQRSGLASFFGLGKKSKSKSSDGSVTANTVAGDMNIRSSSGDKVTLRHGSKVKKMDNLGKDVSPNPADLSADGSVYRRADGKLVRRVLKSPSTSSESSESSQEGDVYRRSDGKLVRRIARTKSGTVVPTAQMNLGAGKAAASSAVEGQVYRRSDGKLARKVARTKSGTVQPPEIPVGQVYRNSSGKLVRKVAKTQAGESVAQNEESSVYRRADGKLVRRRKVTPADKAKAAAESKPGLGKMVRQMFGGGSKKAKNETQGLSLDEKEERIAEQYRKMLKMGLPPDAVRHKMESQDVDPIIIAAVLEEENPDVAKYQKMLAMGLSADAVRQKMNEEGATSDTIEKVLGNGIDQAAPGTESTTSQDLSDQAQFELAYGDTIERYQKMLKMGIPEVAVRQKMEAAGLDDRVFEAVFQQEAAIKFDTAQRLIKQYEEIAADYKRMLEEGVSSTAVREKMHIDGVDVKIIAALLDGGSLKELAEEEASKAVSLQHIDLPHDQQIPPTESSEAATPKEESPASEIADPPKEEGLFEVEVNQADASKQPAGEANGFDPNKTYAEIGEGKEVVDSKVAHAARAVSALGEIDLQKLLQSLQMGDMEILMKKLIEAEKRQKKLEKQLAQAGVAVAEDIEYIEAKQKVTEIAHRMAEIGGSDATVANKEEQVKLREEYFKLEQEMERFNAALVLTEEYQAEQDAMEKKWETDNAPGNLRALKMIRRNMPVNIRNLSEAELTKNPSPNGKYLPIEIARKFKRTNVLQCIRMDPNDIERMHPSTLENMRVTGLTLTERRALYCHLKPLGPKWERNKAEKMAERKWTWFKMMKNNFKENLAPYQRHINEFGPPGRHKCNLIGKQCPVVAEQAFDYSNDYGYPDGDIYEVSDVRKADVDDPGAKAMQEAIALLRERKANERSDVLKKHYKGKLLQVSKANGSCEGMDEAMDRMENHTMKWMDFIKEKGRDMAEADKKKEVANFTDAINELKLSVLGFCQRSGMQVAGKKSSTADAPDPRSSVEAGLAEEVMECSQELFTFVRKRLKENAVVDTRVEMSMEVIENMLRELSTKNLQLLRKLGEKRPARSRKLMKNSDLEAQVEAKRKQKKDASEEGAQEAASPAPPRGPPGRGGLLDAIKSGRDGSRPQPGGRAGLLDAIAGRGRGGGRGRSGGRAGLLSAIKAGGRGK